MPTRTAAMPAREAKAARIPLRVTPGQKERIERVAALLGQDVTTFVVTAAVERAMEVEQAHRLTALSEAHFEAFAAALDAPARRIDGLAALAAAAPPADSDA